MLNTIKLKKISRINFIHQRDFIKFKILILFFAVLVMPDKSLCQNDSVTNSNNFIVASPKNMYVNVDLNDATAAIKVWGEELQKQLKIGARFELKIFDTAEDIVKSPVRDELGLIIINSPDYLKIKSQMQLYPVIVPFERGDVYSRYLILTKKGAVKNLKELKNKKLALPDIKSNPVPDIWLNVLMKEKDADKKNKFFSSVKEFDNNSRLILSVFFGQNDVCVVSKAAYETVVELNPQVGIDLNILAESPGYLTGLSCLSKNSKRNKYGEKVVNACKNLDNYAAGKQILTLMKTEKVTTFKPEYLKSITNLLKEYKELKNN